MTGKDKPIPQTIYVDNQGSIGLAEGTAVSSRSKHIDIRYHYLQDAVSIKKLMLKYIPSSNQIADPLTKPLYRNLFQNFVAKMGLSDSPPTPFHVQGGVLLDVQHEFVEYSDI